MEIERKTPVSQTMVVTIDALVQRGDDQDTVREMVTVSKGTTLDTAVSLQVGRTKFYSVVAARPQNAHEASWEGYE